jgi:hypothetical protein
MPTVCQKAYILKKTARNDNCWLWTGEVLRNGYGRATCNGHRYLAHRLAYTEFVGLINPGYVVDHLCNVKNCVNPNHLRCCTQRENLFAEHSNSVTKQRKQQTHCVHGHKLTEDNVYRMKCGGRACRACRTMWSREYEKTRKPRRARV